MRSIQNFEHDLSRARLFKKIIIIIIYAYAHAHVFSRVQVRAVCRAPGTEDSFIPLLRIFIGLSSC